MYLSRIELDTSRRETIRALGSPYVMHGAIENCYHKLPDQEPSRKLWRLDRLESKLYLLLLSVDKPDFAGFITQFCSPDVNGESKPYDRFLAGVRAGQYWRFRLRANPVHSVRTGIVPSCRGKVYAHVTVQQQKQWLQKKAACCGFGFANSDAEDRSFDVVESETLRFNRQNKYVTLGVATFEGVLRVTDSEVFTRALTNGIGRAKAFGCGLLTIARLS